jgi:hypothetical protein
VLTGLSLLRAAHDAAVKSKLDRWQFAINLRELTAAGLSETDLRLMMTGGLAEHAQEQLRPRARSRSFRRTFNLALTNQSCFVLTPAGARLLASIAMRPRWDGERRQLWYGKQLVKHFRRRAGCQETVLAAFEEEGWPPRIDDPLPRVAEIDPRDRLHDAVRRLNRGHLVRRLAFRRDGTGQGVTWSRRQRKTIRGVRQSYLTATRVNRSRRGSCKSAASRRTC